MDEPPKITDEAWLDVLAEIRNQHANGADTFVVRTIHGRPKVIAADERSSHTAKSSRDE